jgi:glutamate synthase domain-containing protein 1
MFAVVCWIKRAKRLGLNVPLDDTFEKDLMKAIDAKSHKELEARLEFLHDETFEAIVESIIKRKKKRTVGYRKTVRDIYV